VKDTEQDSLTMKRIIRELSDIKPDMIVGPVYPQQVKMAGKYAQAHNIQLISPLSAKPQLVNANSNILQVIPSRMVESEAMARYLKLHAKGQIILIRGTDSASMSNSWRFKKHLLGDMPLDSSGHVLKFRDFKLNDSLMRVLTTVLSKDLNNIVVVFSDHEPGVSRLVTRLNMMSPLYGIELFGMPSWQGMKTIDLNYLHNLQLGIFTPFYIDFSDSAVVKFLKAFRALYGYEPYEQTVLGFNYAMLGYDVGLYFLTALMSYGCDFPLCLKHLNADQLLTKFDFRRSGTGGYVNNSVVIIRYQKDFSVEKLSIVAPAPAF
jgi:ABC-type branched-subunit amino acid transport system substrate-binding protein